MNNMNEKNVNESEEIVKAHTSFGTKVKNFGNAIKNGAKKVVDSTPFRVVTGTISAVAVGVAIGLATGLIGEDDTSADFGSDDILNLDSSEYDVSDVSETAVEA